MNYTRAFTVSVEADGHLDRRQLLVPFHDHPELVERDPAAQRRRRPTGVFTPVAVVALLCFFTQLREFSHGSRDELANLFLVQGRAHQVFHDRLQVGERDVPVPVHVVHLM